LNGNWKHTKHSNCEIYQFTVSDNEVVLQPKYAVSPDSIGAVRQLADSMICRGRRIRFQADLSTQQTDGAGLWLMANHKDWHVTDGMYDRLVKGSSDWLPVELVIDVPENAAYISYGLWMQGNGKCSIRNAKFDIVDESIAVTTKQIWDRIGPQQYKPRTA